MPREQVITRVVKFPAVRWDELAQMAALYAKAQLPYPDELTVADFHVLSQQEGFSLVAIVACQREAAERQLALMREAGLQPHLLTVSSWGVLGWYRRLPSASGAASPVPEPALVINVDDARTDFALVAQGRIFSSRSLGQGVADWASAGEVVELLALEVERSRAAIRKELPNVEVRSLLLTGLGALAEWRDALAPKVSLPIAVVPALQPFTSQAQLAADVSPVVAGGLALGEVQDLLNLSPPQLRAQSRHRRQVHELSLAGLLLLGVLAAGASVLGVRVWRQQRLAAQAAALIAEVNPRAKQLQEQMRLNQLVTGILQERRDLAELLAGVLRGTPPAVTFERITFERARGELSLRGSAATTQQVLGYLKQLEALSSVSGARLKYTSRRISPAGERTEFEVVLQGREAS